QAVLESGSRVNVKDELNNGELDSSLQIRSSGYVQQARILSEEQNGDFLTVIARVEVTPDSQCSTGPTSYYKKTIGMTGFELQVPQQARLGELSNISRELPKDLADQINKKGYLRALTATNIAIYPDLINA
ncbi:flagella assembly protein FlgT middle domain-containing protein, partial [Escherichia coli]|uniref:flagella assembly protein FlgT middle domain-containing protein n=1 Tax=Escherichia coli TaxID=562 RepID=UPI003FA5F427